MSFDLSSLVSAIIGGLIAGGFALLATHISYKNQIKQAQENDEKLIKSLLQSIHDEIETIYEIYQDSIGEKIDSLNEGEALNVYYPIESDYFTVYRSNCFLIGRITDNDLRKQIIKTYTLAQGMVDAFHQNSAFVEKRVDAYELFIGTQDEVHKTYFQEHDNQLVEYAKIIKESHMSFKQEISELFKKLRKNGVSNEKSN